MRSKQTLFAVLFSGAILASGCSQETLQGIEFVCQLDAECNDDDPCTQTRVRQMDSVAKIFH